MRVPAATYRIQFRPGFGFEQARDLLPYLESLGVTDLYASPVLRARTGSSHGYDVTDPTRLNPELGTRRQFESLVTGLRERGLGLLLDIVPNHMAMGSENPWWMDVLEHGRASRYAGFFDIDWAAPSLEGKVLVPVLGHPYGEVLDRGELSLALVDGALVVRYLDDRFPVDPKTFGPVFAQAYSELRERIGAQHPAVRSLGRLLRDADAMPGRHLTGIRSVQRRARMAESIHRRLGELTESRSAAGVALEAAVRAWGGAPTSESARDRLDSLIAEQAYLLSYWRAAVHEIDYRRFFDVNELVSLRTHEGAVFEATHALILDLVKRHWITGLRVDHVDGLRDPKEYLERLARRSDREYVVVEKILTAGEMLRGEWEARGTTGYEFLEDVNGLLVEPDGVAALGREYVRLTGQEEPFAAIATRSKRRATWELFQSELGALSLRLQRLARGDRRGRDLTQVHLAHALAEVTAALPAYRTYVRGFELSAEDRSLIERAVESARDEVPAEGRGALEFLSRVLVLDVRPRPRSGEQPGGRARDWLEFVIRWQQFTGPVMAKGVEDTAMYVYDRLLSRNDVGTDPGSPGTSTKDFHERMRARAAAWPGALSATSTHDSKRSEDVRARINVLSEIPQEWSAAVEGWMRRNARLRRSDPGPDRNEEWMIYQTLVGTWPLGEGEPDFADRVVEFVRKALREGKVHSNWIDSNGAYEESVTRFVRRLLADASWLKDFGPIQRRVAFHGALNSLSQTLIKIAAPGVPDLYQGTELWSLTLVDPDNRRPVDFAARRQLLAELDERPPSPSALIEGWEDGRIKLWVTSRALRHRRRHPALFARGGYVPLGASGTGARHLVAFARRRGTDWAVVLVPRSTVALGPGVPLGPDVWGSASLAMPRGAPRRWTDVLTGASVESVRGRLPLGQVLSELPVSLLAG